jgi:hypothetical protein
MTPPVCIVLVALIAALVGCSVARGAPLARAVPTLSGADLVPDPVYFTDAAGVRYRVLDAIMGEGRMVVSRYRSSLRI